MADESVLEAAASVGEETSWGSLTPEQKAAEVDSAIAKASGAPVPEKVEPTADTVQEETPVDGDVIPAADDSADASEVDGEDVPAEVKPADWLTDDIREYASAMGVNEDDLSGFGSREELDRALRIIDRKAFEAAKAPPPEKAVAPPPPVQQKVPPVPGDPLAILDSFALGEELTAEDAPKLFGVISAMGAELKAQREWRASLEQQQAQAAVESIRGRAIESIHALGHSELFGKPGEKPTAEQKANIEKALEAHFIHAKGLIAIGRQPDATVPFLKAAVHSVFGDTISKLEKQRLTDKLRKQSARRTGGTAAKQLPPPPPENETDTQRARRIAAEVEQEWRERRDKS